MLGLEDRGINIKQVKPRMPPPQFEEELRPHSLCHSKADTKNSNTAYPKFLSHFPAPYLDQFLKLPRFQLYPTPMPGVWIFHPNDSGGPLPGTPPPDEVTPIPTPALYPHPPRKS